MNELSNNYANNLRIGFCNDDENCKNLKQQLLAGTIGPEVKEKRVVTDKTSGIAMIICLVVKVLLFLCTIPYWRDVNTIITDKNIDDENSIFSREYSKQFNRDTRSTSGNTWEDMENRITEMMSLFLAATAVSIVFCGIFVLLFRYYTKALVWGILITSMIFFVVGTIGFWIAFATMPSYDSNPKSIYLTFGIVFGIFTLCILCVCACMFSKIPLVIMLFKEAMKAIFTMPVILFQPILTSVCFIGYASYFVFVFFRLVTATESDFINFNLYYNIFMLYWVVNFIMGCQHMVISGSIAAYFFTRDKSNLKAPVNTSFSHLARFHLGTVALGSLLVSLAEMLKSAMRRNGILGLIGRCLCESILQFVKYLTKNAYIYTAIHGKPFIYSGKMVVKLLRSNIFNVVALNSVGGYIIFLSALLIVGMSSVAGYLIGYSFGPNEANYTAVFALALSLLLCNCLFTVIQMSIDTIFLCFCEDSLLNNGLDRPFLMSTNLMQFIDNSQKILGKKALQRKEIQHI